MTQIEDQSVDVVVATHLLCSVKDIDKSLKEIKRVLKGVKFFFDYFSEIRAFFSQLKNSSQ
jgi:ubiquinone/menaquinone biosynthesis C-methylase UbiE